MTTLQELQTELATLPTLIATTAASGNTVAARRLKQRQAELPEEIDAAQLDATRAQLADIEAQRAALVAPMADARAALVELQSQRAIVDAAIADASQRLHVVSSKLSRLVNQREQLRRLASAQRAENARKWADVPLDLHGSALDEHFRLLYPLVGALPDGPKAGEVQMQRPDLRDNTPPGVNRV